MSAPKSNDRTYERVSTVQKKIRLRRQQLKIAEEIVREFKLSPVAARVLAARGYKADEELKHYISPTLKDGLPPPAKLKGLKEASELIAEIIKDKKPIAICCDFDVDGLSGGSQVHHFLTSVGAKSQVFVPDRFEDGYGLNANMVQSIADQGFGLLIAIDYGTTNLKELALAKKLGLKTIVVDHHHVGTIKSNADVFINPQQKGCGFAGKILSAAGLAWYLIVGLKNTLPEAKHIEARSYLDLACLGTICDMVPLTGANRIIAKRGLELLSESRRPGLLALKQVVGAKVVVTCSDVSFGIGPRLNAAGRMVHGNRVIDLLTTSDSDSAGKLARELNTLNLQRQDIENQVKESAIEKVKALSSLPAGIVVWDESFHTGVVGIVAQRMVEAFYRPTVVMGIDSPGIYKGSVRGIKGFNVVEALTAVGECLIKYGGHEGAGGLSVAEERLEEFAAAFVEECEKRLEGLETQPFAEADTEIDLVDLNHTLVEELKAFAPFGMGNPNPTLLLKDLKVKDIKILKDAHLKATLTDGTRQLSAVMWRQTGHPALIVGSKVNIAFRPEINNFNGLSELLANLQALEPA